MNNHKLISLSVRLKSLYVLLVKNNILMLINIDKLLLLVKLKLKRFNIIVNIIVLIMLTMKNKIVKLCKLKK